MNRWNRDINQAPRGYYRTVKRTIKGVDREIKEHVPQLIIAAGNNGIVTVSKWLPDQQRWNMFSKDTPPIAWQPWPDHPDAEGGEE